MARSSQIRASHYYASAGDYVITLSADFNCMPRDVTASVTSINTRFDKASLDCPVLIEDTAKEICTLSVLQGSGLKVTDLLNTGIVVGRLPGMILVIGLFKS